MGTYGRNFDFRWPPETENRLSRFCAPAAGNALPIGVPVKADTAAGRNGLGLQIVALCAAGDDPVLGMSGIAVFEYGPAAFAGNDPFLATYSDKDTIPLGAAVQVVHGTYVKVVLTNTPNPQTFLGARVYAGRMMVAGVGATPTVAVGDYLEPGTGTDAAGYWREGAAPGAWMVVTAVDAVRGEVEAQMLF